MDDKLKDNRVTRSGLKIDSVYTKSNKNDSMHNDLPGEFPYTRGIRKDMYRGRLWTMRQYAGFASPEASNNRYKYLLNQGQTGLSIAFDLPTQMGYDSDNKIARSEIGRVGVPICSLADMEILFKDIPLEEISTSMTINATAPILLALYIVLAKKNGVSLDKLRGTIQNDILKEFIARGTYIYPPEPSVRLATDLVTHCSKELPLWNTISVSGYHMSEAGATAVQELAFTFSNAIAYVKSALERGIDINSFVPRFSFFFVAQTNLLEEVAKFRAARRIWAKIVRDRFGSGDIKSTRLRFHAQTAGVTLTAQQPQNNLIRTTIQALAAVLGGAQSLHVNSFDEALGLPTEESVELSLRTQQILAFESGITDTVDPMGGSYFVENLTDRLEKLSFDYINQIEEMGGAVNAIKNGFQSNEIHNSAYKLQKDIEDGKNVVVGVNKYQSSDNLKIMRGQNIDKNDINNHLNRLYSVRKKRNQNDVRISLKELEQAAVTQNVNTMPFIIKCVEVYATVGEISDVFRKVFGKYDG